MNYLLIEYTIQQQQPILKYRKLNKNVANLTKATPQAAGFDLRSISTKTIPARGKTIFDTGLQIELPEGCYGRIAPRSGLAAKHSIDVGAGVIDGDYRGEIKIVLFNHGDQDYVVESGDRIAQLICERIVYPTLQQVEEEKLSPTERGYGGFGSTGK